jgi:hypothetical protein
MNFKKAMRRKIKDEWAVAPSSSLVKRLVRGLDESTNIIERYFPKNQTEREFVSALKDMVEYFNKY